MCITGKRRQKMEKELILQILGLQELKDEREIKTAYMQRLKVTNPEDDPEGFRKLREAYETAVSLLRTEEEAEEEPEKTEMDLWVDKMEALYQDYRTRGDEKAWAELLQNPLCQSLDTSLDARDAAIRFLLSHYYLPRQTWKCLDSEFQFVEDFEDLKERYPADFLEYIRYYTENDYWVDFSRFRMRDGAQQMNVDAYIRTYLDVKNLCDQGQFEQAKEKYGELPAYGLWYPWEDVERMRLMEAEGDMEGAKALAEVMAEGCQAEEGPYAGDGGYILPKAANVMWNAGEKETAFSWWSRLPDHIDSRFGMMKYYLESEETAEKAKEIALDIWEQDGSSQRVDEYVQRANELILRRFERQIKEQETESQKDAIRLEMAWCHYQDKNADAAIRILDAIEPGEDIYYSYHNLKGRVLAALERHEEAVLELREWLSMILATVDDGSEEAKKRLHRKGTAYLMLGFCLQKTGEYEDAEEMLKRAEEENTDLGEKYSAMNALSEVYIAMKQYEKAVDQCDRLIALESRYFPAYVNRQEAYFLIQNGQQVVDNYYKAIEIYPGYYKPYLLAAKVFFFVRQYEDAKGVLERARNNQVEFSDEMKLFEAKILRNLAKSPEDRAPIFEILIQLKECMDPEKTDLEDTSEIIYERALLYWDNHKLDFALEDLSDAIRQNPSRTQYLMVKAEILRDMGKYEQALKTYQMAKEEYEGGTNYHYGVGCCYDELGDQKNAMEHFLKVIARDDKYRDTNEKIADIYMYWYRTRYNPEDFEAAVRYMNQEVENWESCYTLVHRGLMYMEAMKLSKAISDFEKALTFVPDDWAAYNNLGYCYKHKSEFDKSIELYQRSLEILKKNEEKRVLPYSNMADCYEIKRDFKEAIICYEKDLEWYPDRTSFYQEIGDLYFYMGDHKKSIEYYKKAGERWDNKRYMLKIGDVYFAQGQMLRAKNMYKKALQAVANRNEDAYRQYNDYAERLISNMFDYKGGIAILERANQKLLSGWTADSDQRGFNERMQARAYYLMGDLKQAAIHGAKAKEFYLEGAHSEEAYINYPAYRPLHLSQIGECYLYMGQRDKAFEMFQKMGTGFRCKHCTEPGCYECYRNLGLYYLGLSAAQKKDALENYEKALEICPTDLELQEMVKKLRKEIEK